MAVFQQNLQVVVVLVLLLVKLQAGQVASATAESAVSSAWQGRCWLAKPPGG